jgi:hypothetical protein
MERLCKKCGCTKPLDQFKPNKGCKLGYEHTCLACFRIRQRKWETSNPERHRENQLRWQAQNQERYVERKRAWVEKNKEYVSKRANQYAKDHPDWKRAVTAKRRAQKLKAIPPWADMKKIQAFYTEAKKAGLVVDHIIPLQGKLVSGLHVETNLQLLTASENSKKHNKFDPAEV